MKYLKTYEQKDGLTFKEYMKLENININDNYLYCNDSYIIDLNGIEEFRNLIELDCSYNNIDTLPDLSNCTNLKTLFCHNNDITKIVNLNNNLNLKKIDCSDNNLIELPDLSNLTKLDHLNCMNNRLDALPDLYFNKNMRFLFCHNNNLPFKCSKNTNDLYNYLEWYKKEFPYIWDAKKYNL
jgi:Leucine-rich repeat (LRR) protein